ncbi:tRNA-splicing endonuclease-like protein [Lindgomyces ingoldianus]|uniref:tRNA-splicing endonuclease-like protein n=1 Tax=Lindgomyces ingoldianus TaxID=673940 RepID=A0ACB6QG51_9PLEO|nr:tRNA-splicing endonuclease-like protein [Lindgomyces ingoldianus]KAF2465958.1 tRNA-splicing endonuclease-like protein [Lindgomyces ingoldianus]
MADVLERICELQTLPTNQHLFCPRNGHDSSVYFDEDIANTEPDHDAEAVKERQKKILEAQDRKWLTLSALEILSYPGEDARPYQEWLKERLDNLMTSCDVQFDEDTVAEFFKTVDDFCIERIKAGMKMAAIALNAAEPKSRGIRILSSQALYAFFEALSCDAFIRDEELLQDYFDKPFQMVQTKKRLKVQTFLPSITRFLFRKNSVSQDWALVSCATFKRNILSSEFEWAVRDYLTEAMMRVQMSNLDLPFVATYWNGVRLIVNKLDKDLITHSLRGLDGDFYRLLLDHLSLQSEGFFDLIGTMTLLLEKSPTSFWDAMDAITPSTATIVEQVFNSPFLKKVLLSAEDCNEDDLNNLRDAFAWITPFLSSIKTANLAPVCRAFANQFFGRLQSDQFSHASRAYCFKEGLQVLEYAFRRMNQGKTVSQFVGQPTVNGMLEMLSSHIGLIVTSVKRFVDEQAREELRLALSMIQNAFTLECHSLSIEKQLIEAKQPSPTETPPSSPIWKTIISAIDAKHIDLATHLLIAGRNLIGLQSLSMKTGIRTMPPTIRHFNNRFELLSQSITDVIDRLSEFDSTQLEALFMQPASASSVIATLFSSSEETRNSSVELLKVISLKDERRDAIQHVLDRFYKNVLQGVSDSCRQVTKKKIFAPAPSLIKTCSDIIDIMTNPQNGILRSRNLESGESGVTMALWKNLWDALTIIFQTTEDWSNLGYYDKDTMREFCRDTMQFANYLFDQCSIFSTALKNTMADPEDATGGTKLLRELLELPARTVEAIAKWLRLRDEFLSSRCVTLISRLLVRLRDVSIEVDADALVYMERILSGDVRAKLSMQQQAELQRALETHLGHSIVRGEEPVKPKQESLTRYMSTSSITSENKVKITDIRTKLMADATRTAIAMQVKREANKAKETEAVKQANAKKIAEQAEFKRKRQLEIEKQKKEKAAAIARAKQDASRRGWSEHTAEAGSGLDGLGVLGKDHAPKGEGLMHSSDESEEEGDFDAELFGIRDKNRAKSGPKTNIVNEVKVQMPVKKRRVIRSSKDMRARLTPDLSPLHKVILSWDYYHNGDFPPHSRPDMYASVLKTFSTPNDYQATFEPLLTLEAWQGFVKAREEGISRPYDIRIVSRASVDAFQEVSSTMTHAENKELYISEGDVVLLSKSKDSSREDPHCLARVFRVQRKPKHLEVSYRVMPSNPLQSSLVPNGTVFGAKIQSLTPLEREYGALLGLQYYDLCDEIIRAKPSPLLNYKDNQLEPLISNYKVNNAQAKAVKSAMDNDAFTLIQGPPGSGKTKTIVAIVGAILSDTLRNHGTPIPFPGQANRSDTAAKKLLVCAPSNAAVDELVMRFKEGIKTLSGQERKVNVVRLGRSDAINANVRDVTLEELVNNKLGITSSHGNGNGNKAGDPDATRAIFQEHQRISDQLREARTQLDSGMVEGEDASKLRDDLNALRRRKADLGTKIDTVKDDEKRASRSAELDRRRAQESILSGAHVICATLSGSGHEMFQGMNIEFETVIVDEAAQCVEMSALIPLKYGCAKCILVGDPKQLPPTVLSKEAARFQYEQSLFVRMQGNHPNDVHLLDTQYRMHPEISRFPSQTFYDGKLLDGDNMAGLRRQPWHTSALLAPYRFFDVQGQHQAAPKGHSLINIAEIDVALQLYKRLTSDFGELDFRGKIGIITPYKSQLRELKTRFSARYGQNIVEDVEFNTTDAFQGRESEVIIFSCVRASPAGGIGFLQDIRRMNVGLTRAKSSLWVLGNSQSLVRGQFWRKLVEDARQRNRYTEGNVLKMLGKHSSTFPARKEIETAIPSRTALVKQDPQSHSMSRSTSIQSLSESDMKPMKKEPVDNVEPVSNGKRKMTPSDDDVDMEDAFGESEAPSNTVSGRSTPAIGSDAARNSATPVPEMKEESTPDPPKPGDVLGNMNRPKIRRRPRPEANPFMPRPPTKKPKTG